MIDETLNSQVLELLSIHLPSTFITTPSLATRTLGIKLPILVFLVKNLGKYWSFEVTILDDRGEKRRFRASNFQVGPLFSLYTLKRICIQLTSSGSNDCKLDRLAGPMRASSLFEGSPVFSFCCLRYASMHRILSFPLY